MRTIKILFFITMTIISVVLIAAAIAPDNITITSEITINTKPEQIYNNVISLKKWKFWSPFEHDSTMVDEFSGPESGVGCTRIWKGERIGEGKMTIVEAKPFSSIKNKLDFGAKGGAVGSWSFKAIDTTQTIVIWSTHITGLKFPFEKLMGLFLDSMMKPMFEEGLKDLKNYTETSKVTPKEITSNKQSTHE